MEYAIELKGVTFTYRGSSTPALDGLDLSVRAGEVIAVIGPNGAGKSTLVACLNGFIPGHFRGNFAGSVILDGVNTVGRRVAEHASVVGTVFQDFESQLFCTSVELEVAFGPENLRLPRPEMRARVEESLRAVRLAPFRSRAPAQLSGGQKQKLAIASVLAMRPRVLVLDEPTTDLDPVSRREIFDLPRALQEQQALTVVVVEHETEEMHDVDRVLLLDRGRIRCCGSPREVLTNAALLEQHGVRPPSLVPFFERLELPPPLTLEEAEERLAEGRWEIDSARHATLVSRDRVAASEPIIECRALHYAYEDSGSALRGVNTMIRDGEVTAIAGTNGSGKTTLARHLNGLLHPSSGEVRIGGRCTTDLSVTKLGQEIGYVFQNPDHQLFCDTVFDEVAFGLRLRNLAEEEVTTRVRETLDAVGLSGMEEEDPFSLPKSGRQRVAVAAALALRPSVLVLDEPTTGLDYREQRALMEVVKDLNAAGSSIVIITHHMWVVAEYAHHVIVMHEGSVLVEGRTRDVFRQEALLAQAGIRLPDVVALSNRLGGTALSANELLMIIGRQ